MALALVARRWTCTIRYIGGTQCTKAGLGVVRDGAERPVSRLNPLDLLGHMAADDALTLCANQDYSAAATLLEAAIARMSDAETKANLQALAHVVTGFAQWDRFQHRDAGKSFYWARKEGTRLTCFLAPHCAAELQELLPKLGNRARKLANNSRPCIAVIEDLLANAQRRRREQRHDDAVARLYRAIEAMAQYRLASKFEITSTTHFPADKVPDALKDRIQGRGAEVKLGLQDAHLTLAAYGDELGRTFQALRLESRQERASILAQRNSSILAHGFQPVPPSVSDQMWAAALQLAAVLGIEEANLGQFPALERRWQ